jgi:hypothetical protein
VSSLTWSELDRTGFVMATVCPHVVPHGDVPAQRWIQSRHGEEAQCRHAVWAARLSALHSASVISCAAGDTALSVRQIDRALALVGTQPHLVDLRLLLLGNRASELAVLLTADPGPVLDAAAPRSGPAPGGGRDRHPRREPHRNSGRSAGGRLNRAGGPTVAITACQVAQAARRRRHHPSTSRWTTSAPPGGTISRTTAAPAVG